MDISRLLERNAMSSRCSWMFVILTISISVFTYSRAQAQVETGGVLLSPSVGNTIDREEREYFNLFPGVEGFDSALVSLRNDSILFQVARSNMPDTVIKVDPTLTDVLRSYIERFEFIFDSRYPENDEQLKKCGLLILACRKLRDAGLVRLGEVVQQDVPEVTVVLKDSTGISGRVLAYRDSEAVLWDGGNTYR